MMIPEPWEHHDEMDAEEGVLPANATAWNRGTVPAHRLHRRHRHGRRSRPKRPPSEPLLGHQGRPRRHGIRGRRRRSRPGHDRRKGPPPARPHVLDRHREGRIIRDHEVKAGITSARPYADWLESELVTVADLPEGVERRGESSVAQLQQEFGYTIEEKKLLIAPMARDGKEAIGSMGTTPDRRAVGPLTPRVGLLPAVVRPGHNPPLDAIREEIITSLFARVGPEGNLFDPWPPRAERSISTIRSSPTPSWPHRRARRQRRPRRLPHRRAQRTLRCRRGGDGLRPQSSDLRRC